MTKKCSKCKSVKPITDFRVQSDRKNRSSQCLSCRQSYQSTYDKTRRDLNERRQRCRNRYYKNRESASEYSREWRKRNPEKQREQNRRRHARNKSNIQVRIKNCLRTRIRDAVRCGWKSGRTMELLGCSIKEFKMYLERQFKRGMNWRNYGRKGWHIDHKVPCAMFDLVKPEHQRICFHYSNMQPLWENENLSKGKRVTNPQLQLL